jgi:competence protein ComEA
MKPWQHVILGILVGLCLSAVIYLVAVQPRGEPVVLKPAPTPGKLIVQVAGEVANPGVYGMEKGSRVLDVIQAAGGLSTTGDPDSINQAALLQDGQKVTVKLKGSVNPASSTSKTTAGSPAKVGPNDMVNINTATLEQLITLPGIGEDRANAILSYRDQHGPFTKIEDLQNVEGIGEGIFNSLKNNVTVSGSP